MIPLFLFSLPRSGSTLTQRILSSHTEISTVSEPWILLPFLYTLKQQGVYSEYGHKYTTEAIEQFCLELPNGKNDYLAEIRSFVLQLYAKAAKDRTKYFLDKTPRYSLVVEDIINLFPEGKFVFLWRNPLAVVSSIVETWTDRKFNLLYNRIDLFEGLSKLIAAYEKYADKSCVIHYETLLSNPESELKRLLDYLEIPFDPSLLSAFSNIQLPGKLGDKTGIHQYQLVSKEPLAKWKHTINNPIRKAWCRRYLRWIGKERLAVMGYSLEELLTELDTSPFSLHMVGADLIRIIYGTAYNLLEIQLIKN